MSNYENLIYAIQNKRIIIMKFNSDEKGIITRFCVPFDYGLSLIDTMY